MNKLIEAMIRQDEPGNIAQIDARAFTDAVEQLHQRFVDERVNGFIDPNTGQHQAPVTREQAEARWQKALPNFQRVLFKDASTAGDTSAKRLGLVKGPPVPASSTYSSVEGDAVPGEVNPEDFPPDPAMRGDRAMRDEPALRRGESRTSRILNKLLA